MPWYVGGSRRCRPGHRTCCGDGVVGIQNWIAPVPSARIGGREVSGVFNTARFLRIGGGGIHCATLQDISFHDRLTSCGPLGRRALARWPVQGTRVRVAFRAGGPPHPSTIFRVPAEACPKNACSTGLAGGLFIPAAMVAITPGPRRAKCSGHFRRLRNAPPAAPARRHGSPPARRTTRRRTCGSGRPSGSGTRARPASCRSCTPACRWASGGN